MQAETGVSRLPFISHLIQTPRSPETSQAGPSLDSKVEDVEPIPHGMDPVHSHHSSPAVDHPSLKANLGPACECQEVGEPMVHSCFSNTSFPVFGSLHPPVSSGLLFLTNSFSSLKSYSDVPSSKPPILPVLQAEPSISFRISPVSWFYPPLNLFTWGCSQN